MNKKKILAAAVLVALFAPTAYAGKGPVVTLGGELNSQYGYVKHDANNQLVDPSMDTTDVAAQKYTKNAIVNTSSLKVEAAGDAMMMGYDTMKVGAVAEINADASPAFDGDTRIGRQTYFFAKSSAGEFSVGTQRSASHDLGVSAINLSSTKETGLGGEWAYRINPKMAIDNYDSTNPTASTVFTADNMLLYPVLFGDNNTVARTDSNAIYGESVYKARYASKVKLKLNGPVHSRYGGVIFGVDYTPHLNSYGTANKAAQVLDDLSAASDTVLTTLDSNGNYANLGVYDHLAYKNVVTGGIGYEYKADNHMGFKISATGQTGNSKMVRYFVGDSIDNTPVVPPATAPDPVHEFHNTKLQRLNTWQVGAELSYMGWAIAGAYGDNNKSGYRKDTLVITENPGGPATTAVAPMDAVKTRYWNAGVGYTHGPVGGYVSYAETTKGMEYLTTDAKPEKNKAQIITVGLDYKLPVEGVLLNAEFFNYKAKDRFNATSINASSPALKQPHVRGVLLNLKVNV